MKLGIIHEFAEVTVAGIARPSDSGSNSASGFPNELYFVRPVFTKVRWTRRIDPITPQSEIARVTSPRLFPENVSSS
jgi:hypothetical protein